MTGWVVSELKPRVRSSPAPPPAPEIVGRLTAKQLRDPVLVTSRLCRLTEVGGEHNYVIVEVGRCRYVQFLSSCGSAVMYAEPRAVSIASVIARVRQRWRSGRGFGTSAGGRRRGGSFSTSTASVRSSPSATDTRLPRCWWRPWTSWAGGGSRY